MRLPFTAKSIRLGLQIFCLWLVEKTYTPIKEKTFQTCSRQSSTSGLHNDLQSSTIVFHKLARKQKILQKVQWTFLYGNNRPKSPHYEEQNLKYLYLQNMFRKAKP
jgi:hypothetical protein